MNLSLKFTNQTAWPARVEDNLSYRYYMDLSEVIAAGSKPEDVVIRCDRDQSAMYSDVTPAQISGIQHYSGDIYYVEVTYPDGRAAIPISEGRYQCETMLALVFPNYGKGWDSTNDYSCQDIEGAEDNVMTDKITVYQNGVLLYGIERAFVEGLRTDSLMWGSVRVSQALGGVLFIVAAGLMLFIFLRGRKPMTLEYIEGQKKPRFTLGRYVDTKESRERIAALDAKLAEKKNGKKPTQPEQKEEPHEREDH